MACIRIVQVDRYFWPVRGCASLNKKKSQAKAVEVTVNSKEKTFETFVWISSKNLASGSKDTSGLYQNYAGKKMLTACTKTAQAKRCSLVCNFQIES